MVVRKWHADNPVPEPNTTRLCRNEAKEDLRRTHMRVPPKRMMLHCPNSIKADSFGFDRLFDAMVQSLPFVFS